MFEEGRKLYTGEINAAVRGAGGRRDRGDRRHGLPRRRRGLRLQLPDRRGTPTPPASSSSRKSGRATRPSGGGLRRRALRGHARDGGAATASSTTPSRGCSGRTCGSTARRRDGNQRRPLRRLGCPVLLVTGDDAVCAESTALLGDGLTTVSVKQGLGLRSARMLVPSRARELIEEARKALSDLKAVSPYDPGKPAEIKVEYTSTDPPQKLRFQTGVELSTPARSCRAPTTGGQPGSSSSSRGISPSASQRRSQTTRGSSAAPSRRGRRGPSQRSRSASGHVAIRGPEMLRREVVQHHDASGGYELERPLTLGTHLRGRAALPAAAVEEEQAERRFRRQELVPVAMERARPGDRRRVQPRRPRAPSSSTVTSSASGSIADAIQAEPTPVPVPISAARPRGRAAASARGAARPSRIDERSKRIAVASASARWTSCGTGIGIPPGILPEERRLPNLSDAASANVGRSARCRVGRRPRARPRACVRAGGTHLQDELLEAAPTALLGLRAGGLPRRRTTDETAFSTTCPRH